MLILLFISRLCNPSHEKISQCTICMHRLSNLSGHKTGHQNSSSLKLAHLMSKRSRQGPALTPEPYENLERHLSGKSCLEIQIFGFNYCKIFGNEEVRLFQKCIALLYLKCGLSDRKLIKLCKISTVMRRYLTSGLKIGSSDELA